jgi:TolA-binding protein
MNEFMEKRMKKTFITILLFTLILTACGASTSTQTANQTEDANGNNGSFRSAPLPLAMQLVVGTFKLEGTDKAVTANQAAQLIPLWQVYKDLSASTSAAQEEVDALAEQIQGTMTPEQVQAITDMKLTRREIFQTMQELGIASAERPNASGTPRPGGQGGNFQGGGPGGGVPGGGQGFNNGQNLSAQQIATFQARRAQNSGSGQFNRIPPALYDALIKLLQSKK